MLKRRWMADLLCRGSLSKQTQNLPVLTTNKLKSGSVASSKKKQDKGSVWKDIPSSLEELVSKEDRGGTSDSDRTAIAIVKRRTDRRNSYTRLLMSVSKDVLPKNL